MAEVKKKAPKIVNKVKKVIKPEVTPPFENRLDLKQLYLYVVVVPRGQADAASRILKEHRSSAQYIQVGEGTTKRAVNDILDIEDTKKDVIYSLVRDDELPGLKKDFDAYYDSGKKIMGISFAIELNSFIGVKLYKFFTQTVRG